MNLLQSSEQLNTHRASVIVRHIILGGLLGIVFLHPATMAMYWFEFSNLLPGQPDLATFLLDRIQHAFVWKVLPMTGYFFAMGGVIGGGSAAYQLVIQKSSKLILLLADELNLDIQRLILEGESFQLEFKESARWNVKAGCVDKKIEHSIVKTIAAFLNHKGGNLLIGVRDDGSITGLDSDYKTLSKPTNDYFELFLNTLIKNKLGASTSCFIHTLFHENDHKSICRVIVEPASFPIFLKDKGRTQYFVRSGNSSRELDIEEATKHINSKKRT